MSTLDLAGPVIMCAIIWLPLRLTRPKANSYPRRRFNYQPGRIIGADGQEL